MYYVSPTYLAGLSLLLYQFLFLLLAETGLNPLLFSPTSCLLSFASSAVLTLGLFPQFYFILQTMFSRGPLSAGFIWLDQMGALEGERRPRQRHRGRQEGKGWEKPGCFSPSHFLPWMPSLMSSLELDGTRRHHSHAWQFILAAS